MSTMFNNLSGKLVLTLAAGLIATQVAAAKGPGGGGGGSHGAGSAPRMSVRMSTPSFQATKSFSVGNANFAKSAFKTSDATGKLPGVIVRDRLSNGVKHVKISDAIHKDPKLNPKLVDKFADKINPKPSDPGKGNGKMPGNSGKKFCKPHCNWPWFPAQIGWFPYGCYPYGYPYGGYRFGCNRTVSYSTPTIDLALEDVRLVEPATVAAGPAYRVTFRNLGNAAAGGFRVAIFGSLDGQVSEDTQAAADIRGLGAGESTSLVLRLPISAMHMSDASTSQAVPFKLLTVVLDSDNVVPESVKDNNAATLERSSFETR